MTNKVEDIFHMLLDDKDRQKKMNEIETESSKTKGNVDYDVLPFDLNFSVDSKMSGLSNIAQAESLAMEFIESQGWSILDHCKDDYFLYVLAESKENVICVQIYRLNHDKKVFNPTLISTLTTSFKLSLFKDNKGPDVRHMYIVQQDDQVSTYPGIVHLSTPSFASIFSKTTALTKSSVVLLSANDGCVYWGRCGLKEVTGKMHKFFMLCQLHGVVNAIVTVSLSVVCKTSSIDVDITGALQNALSGNVKTGDSDLMTGLLAVCDIGECCLIFPMTKSGLSRQSKPIRFCLPHSIVSCVAKGNKIFYSTGSTVEIASLTLTDDGQQLSVSLVDCITIKMADIGHLVFHHGKDHSEPQLKGLTTDLDMITIPMTSPSMSLSSHNLTSKSHLIPNDALAQINHHYSSIQALQKKSGVLDMFLSQLNLFANLYHRHQQKISNERNMNTNVNSPPVLINCECYCYHRHENSKHFVVQIQLRNDTKITIPSCWSLLVKTIPESPFLKQQRCDVESYSLKMEGEFKPGCKKHFFIPVPQSTIFDPAAQLRVHVSLILSIPKNYLENSPVAVFSDDESCDLLEVEIHECLFDYLNFLTVSSEITESFDSNSAVFIKACLDRLAEKKRGRPLRQESTDRSADRQTICMKLYHSDVCDGDAMAETKREIMQSLFQDVNHFPESKDLNTHLVCKTPYNAEICFTLEDSESQADKKSRLQLKMESTDSVLLSAVHVTLLERLKLYCLKKTVIKHYIT